jgi:hypothetical protein
LEKTMIRSRSKIPTNSFLLDNAPEHLKLIGLIAVNQAHLDRTLCRLLSLLAGLDSRAAQALLLTSSTNALRGEILANLARRRSLSPESMMQLEACLARVKRSAQRRDEMSNSAYGVGRDGLVIAPSRDQCGEIVPFPLEELRQLADNIAECTAELDRLAATVRLDEELGQYSQTEDAAPVLPT